MPALEKTRNALAAWVDEAIRGRWLDDSAREQLTGIDLATPAKLFEQTLKERQRPLVVALCGGTGAGKSTLLNRLAGEDIAKASVIRPTSREVTVYVHRDVPLQDLQALLPLQRVGVAYHSNADWQSVLFIDTPDIDSLELENHERLRQWLPYVDVLMYVVNPERYRDDKGWQLLRQQLHDHAWMFVMNHWDQGHPMQRADFNQQLKDLGFEEAAIYCTDCHTPNAEDDFSALSAQIAQLAEARLSDLLEWRSQRRLWKRLQDEQARLIDEIRGGGQPVLAEWQARWQQAEADVVQACMPSFAQYAAHFSTQRQGWKALVMGPGELAQLPEDTVRQRGLPELSPVALHTEAALSRLSLLCEQNQQPAAPLSAALEREREQQRSRLNQQLETHLLKVMQQPNEGWRARARGILQRLSFILPVACLAWAALRLLVVYLSPQSQGGYLNVDFAVHTIMLVGLAWLLPQVLANSLAPSWQEQVQAGLRQGLRRFIDDFSTRIKQVYEQYQRDQSALLERLPPIEPEANAEPNRRELEVLKRFTVPSRVQ